MKHEIGDGSFVQKRKYTKGFFVNIGKKKTDAEEKISNNENATNNTKQEEAKNTHELTVTASTDTSIIINETQEVDYFVGDCDEIILKNGEVISAKVTDVGVDEIKYKKCDNPTGPNYSILKSEVFMIKYANGTKDVFNKIESDKSNSTEKYYNNNQVDKPVLDPLSMTGFVLSLLALVLGFFVASLLGILIGILSLLISHYL
jgi:hypothetical protein